MRVLVDGAAGSAPFCGAVARSDVAASRVHSGLATAFRGRREVPHVDGDR